MKRHGIGFKGDMVRAILDDRKNLTSRLPGLETINAWPSKNWRYDGLNMYGDHLFFDVAGAISGHDTQECVVVVKCPYGQPRDILIGRETWATTRGLDHVKPRNLVPGFPCEFRAGGATCGISPSSGLSGFDHLCDRGRWRPGIHLPFWASRLKLEVVKVWPSRLQDMTEEMAIQEGVLGPPVSGAGWRQYPYESCHLKTAIKSYQTLWDLINGKTHPWASNPWVWRIQFKRLKP